jgi:hypothetical protein
MKKVTAISTILLGIILLAGCGQKNGAQDQLLTQPSVDQKSTQPIKVNQPVENESSANDYLSRYGDNTKLKDPAETVNYQAPEIGVGSLLNDSEGKSLEKWYFVHDGKNKEKYLLIIGDDCLIDSVGFMNGSCVKYFSLDENKNISYDGHNGPGVRIYGKMLPNKSIQVSNITIVQ